MTAGAIAGASAPYATGATAAVGSASSSQNRKASARHSVAFREAAASEEEVASAGSEDPERPEVEAVERAAERCPSLHNWRGAPFYQNKLQM